jgi:hypothetical protein
MNIRFVLPVLLALYGVGYASPAHATPSAPATGGIQMYCLVYEEGTNQQLKPPAAMAAEGNVWKVSTTSVAASEDDAIALAKAQGMKADFANCASSIEILSRP